MGDTGKKGIAGGGKEGNEGIATDKSKAPAGGGDGSGGTKGGSKK